jgi:hypothetical protein
MFRKFFIQFDAFYKLKGFGPFVNINIMKGLNA